MTPVAPVVVFPDAVALTVRHLRDGLDARSAGAAVGAKVPGSWPAPFRGFVLARRTGGTRRDVVTDRPQVSVECWHDTEHEAHALASVARALMFALPGSTVGGHAVYRVEELGGLAALPDPISSKPRYVFTHVVHIRGAGE